VRPQSLSVTEIERLIRDPYAIYARHVLGLRPLAPVSPAPDARLRGEALHALVEAFVRESDGTEDEEAGRARLLAVTDRLLAEIVPWPAARRLWRGRIERLATAFVADEAERRRQGRPVVLEQKGAIEIGQTGFRLVARPDRIDRLEDGRVQIYDYKTGAVPSPKRQRRFDNQLLLEACMVQRGAFPDLGPVTVAAITYVRLGGDGAVSTQTFDAELDAGTWKGLLDLIARYQRRDTPYPPRAAMFRETDESDYDHLSRFGEWPMTEAWLPEDVE
jgi:ATP-dependent helicase/nuclease subunit B